MISFSKLGNFGRIGNSLFEMACTIALALRNDDKYLFPLCEAASFFNLYNCFTSQIIHPTFTYKEPFFHYQKIPYQDTKNNVIDLEGYFQSEKYFSDYQEIIIGLLTPRKGFGIQYNTTAIHVRRGDYLTLTKEYQQLNMEYYHAAMHMINSQKYLIFSDEIEWCKQNFHGNNITFSENRKPIEDLSLFLSCEHAIIANSSFSWWGAYLNKNPSKIVIAPEKWFGPAQPHNTWDLIPESWLKI